MDYHFLKVCTVTPKMHLADCQYNINEILSESEMYFGIHQIYDMKTRASLKKRTPDCVIVRRKGRLFVINKKNPKYKMRQG